MAGEPLRESVLGLHLVADDLDTPLAILHGIPFTDQTLAKLYWGGLRFVGTSRRLARSDTMRPKVWAENSEEGRQGARTMGAFRKRKPSACSKSTEDSTCCWKRDL